MRSKSITRVLDRLGKVSGLLEIEEDVGAKTHAQLALRVARVDGNHAKADGGGVLNCKVTETSTGATKEDKVAGLERGTRSQRKSQKGSRAEGGTFVLLCLIAFQTVTPAQRMGAA
jgi:hypothetical protein